MVNSRWHHPPSHAVLHLPWLKQKTLKLNMLFIWGHFTYFIMKGDLSFVACIHLPDCFVKWERITLGIVGKQCLFKQELVFNGRISDVFCYTYASDRFLYSVAEKYPDPDRRNVSAKHILLISNTLQSCSCRSVRVSTSCKGGLYLFRLASAPEAQYR